MIRRLSFFLLVLAAALAHAQNPNSGFITSTQCITVSATNQTAGSYSITGSWTGTLTAFGIVGQGSPVPLGSQTANGSFVTVLSGYTQFEVCGNSVATGAAFVQVYATVPSTSLTLSGTTAPTGTCGLGAIYTNTSNGNLYACNAGSWLLIGPGTGSLANPATTPGDLYIAGPDPYVDMVAAGAKGDAQQFNSMGATSGTPTTVTIAGSSTSKFAAADCTGGTGCTGTVNKYLAISGGGPNAPTAIPTLTAAAGGSQFANFLAFKITCTMDNGTILNGESLPSAESVIAVTANQKVTTASAPTCPANTTGSANGYRVYLIDPTKVYETIVTAGGTGYTSPVLTFNSGTCTTTPVVELVTAGYGAAGGYVVGAIVTTAGSCTVNPTSCTVSGGGSPTITATATCTYSAGVLAKVTINNNGAGYTMPTIAVTGNGVSGLVASAVITGGAGTANAGVLSGVQILNPGWLNGGFPTAAPTGTVSGGGASVQGTFNFQFGGEMLQPSSICSASSTFHQTLNICDITATINLTVAPSYLLGVYPPYVAEWYSTESAFTSTVSVNIADAIPNTVSGNFTNGANGTDNSGAFTTALGRCPSANTIKTNPGCVIYFDPVDATAGTAVPTGRYLINGGAVIAQNNVTLMGGGPGTTGNAGQQAQGTPLLGIPSGSVNYYSRGWTGPQPPSEIAVMSREWAVHFGPGVVEGGGAQNIAVGDLIGQSAGGFYLDGANATNLNVDHLTFLNTNAENFSNGDCYAADSAQIIWFINAQGICRNGWRALDNVSNSEWIMGSVLGTQGINQPSEGPSYGYWESNNPNSSGGPGNGIYIMPEARDFASGWMYSYEHPGMQVVTPKYENIAMNEAEVAINQQAGAGVGVTFDAFQGTNDGRCTGSQHIGGQFSRTNQDFYDGKNCTGDDFLFPNGVPPTTNGDVVSVTNGTRTDALFGNSMFGSQAGQLNGGTAFVFDPLANNAVTVDCSKGNTHRMAYTNTGGTLTMGNPTNCVDGQQVNFEITNSSGAATESIAWGTNYTNGFATLSTITAGQICVVYGHYNASLGHVLSDTAGTMSATNNCH